MIPRIDGLHLNIGGASHRQRLVASIVTDFRVRIPPDMRTANDARDGYEGRYLSNALMTHEEALPAYPSKKQWIEAYILDY